jgi:hypothetical protein
MADDEQIGEPIMEHMQKFMRENLPGKLVTNYIIIAEVADEETQMLHLSVSETMTPWLAYGMLHSASTMLSEGEVSFPNASEDEIETDETE